MKGKFGKTIVSGLALAFAICVAASANAAVYYASSSGTPCGTPSYSTIQSAVNHATAGSTVDVCAGQGPNADGSYPEQVYINKRLTLVGVAVGNVNQAVISAPASLVSNASDLIGGGPIAAQIYVASTSAVNISNVVVDGGTSWDGSTYNFVGIYYQNASGVLNHVVTRNQAANPHGGSSLGFGIFAEAVLPGKSIVTVENSSVHDFDKNGIVARGSGATLHAILDQVRGNLPAEGDAENGIEIAYGATGSATNNTVSDFIWTGDTPSDEANAADGILVYHSPNVAITANHVSNTQFGIAVVGDGTSATAGETIKTNVVDGALVQDGINVCGSTGDTIASNTIAGSTRAGIHLDGTTQSGDCTPLATGDTTVSANIINEACAGILNGVSNPSGNTIGTIETNTDYNVVNTTLVGDTCP